MKLQTMNGTYGRRGKNRTADGGARRLASTFGKTQFAGHSAKATGRFLVESDAERIATHLFKLSPSVHRFVPQPFTVDLIDGCLLRTQEACAAARAKHHSLPSPRFYTPDFLIEWHGVSRSVAEVKLEGHVGDDAYAKRLELARGLLRANGFGLSMLVIPARRWPPILSNAFLLTQSIGRTDVLPTEQQRCRIGEICGDSGVPLAELCSALEVSPNVIPAWLGVGIVQADIAHHPINGDLHLTLAFGDLSHLDLLRHLME